MIRNVLFLNKLGVFTTFFVLNLNCLAGKAIGFLNSSLYHIRGHDSGSHFQNGTS